MKNYRITVNGTSYDVSVEELSGGAAPVAAPVAAAPVAAPAAPAPAAGGAGSRRTGAPGTRRKHHSFITYARKDPCSQGKCWRFSKEGSGYPYP